MEKKTEETKNTLPSAIWSILLFVSIFCALTHSSSDTSGWRLLY